MDTTNLYAVVPGALFVDQTMDTMRVEDDTIATEAASAIMSINGEPMKIFLCTDKIIENNNIPKVSNPISFVKGSDPTSDGIFSEIIFGSTQKQKTLNHGYIDLHHKFFHPYVFEILKMLHSKITKVCDGESAWIIKDGKFQEITDPDDPKYNPDNTGLQFVMDNFSKLKFEENDSIGHNDKVKFIKSLDKDEIFISKFLVIPRIYRDFSANGTMISEDKINTNYTKLISLANSLQSGSYGYTSHKTMKEIQNLLVVLRLHGQSLIEKKNGVIHRDVLGKNITYGTRGVISVPSLVGCDKPSDCQVNMITSGLPLSTCLQAGYPFIIKWLLDWVETELSGGPMTLYKKNEKGVMMPTEVRLKDHTMIFDKEYLDKRISMFINGFGGRWAPIRAQAEDGSEPFLTFTGRGYSRNAGADEASSIANRPLTWCDLMYMAAENTLSDKHVYCTRYPAEDYFNITPSRVAVLSTLQTTPMMVNGKYYPHYPVINPFESEVNVSRSFIDTISVSNLHLAGFRGDYDGDTLSVKIVFSQEANVEAEKQLHSLGHYMTINGNLIRRLGNESVLCMYNMTRRS